MTSHAVRANQPDNPYETVDTDPGAHGRSDDRAISSVSAADPRWLKLGLTAALGPVVAGALAFARAAEPSRRVR